MRTSTFICEARRIHELLDRVLLDRTRRCRLRWKARRLDGGFGRLVVFDNEGHGFTKKANEIRAYKAILDFLDKHLNGSGPAAAAAAHN